MQGDRGVPPVIREAPTLRSRLRQLVRRAWSVVPFASAGVLVLAFFSGPILVLVAWIMNIRSGEELPVGEEPPGAWDTIDPSRNVVIAVVVVLVVAAIIRLLDGVVAGFTGREDEKRAEPDSRRE